jgi:hypothetical protein
MHSSIVQTQHTADNVDGDTSLLPSPTPVQVSLGPGDIGVHQVNVAVLGGEVAGPAPYRTVTQLITSHAVSMS